MLTSGVCFVISGSLKQRETHGVLCLGLLHTQEVIGSRPVGPIWSESLTEPASAGFSFCDAVFYPDVERPLLNRLCSTKVTAQTLHTNRFALLPLPVGCSGPWPVCPRVAESRAMRGFRRITFLKPRINHLRRSHSRHGLDSHTDSHTMVKHPVPTNAVSAISDSVRRPDTSQVLAHM
jgi:hypothetical protein